MKIRVTAGYSPTSISGTVRNETPCDATFSDMHATTQALHPMHFRVSITMAQLRSATGFVNARRKSRCILASGDSLSLAPVAGVLAEARRTHRSQALPTTSALTAPANRRRKLRRSCPDGVASLMLHLSSVVSVSPISAPSIWPKVRSEFHFGASGGVRKAAANRCPPARVRSRTVSARTCSSDSSRRRSSVDARCL